MVSEDPVERLDFECPDVKAFMASAQNELRASGLTGRERFDAQMAKMDPFARRHVRTCARCRHHAGARTLRVPATFISVALALLAVFATVLFILHPTVARAVGGVLAIALSAAVWFSLRR